MFSYFKIDTFDSLIFYHFFASKFILIFLGFLWLHGTNLFTTPTTSPQSNPLRTYIFGYAFFFNIFLFYFIIFLTIFFSCPSLPRPPRSSLHYHKPSGSVTIKLSTISIFLIYNFLCISCHDTTNNMYLHLNTWLYH